MGGQGIATPRTGRLIERQVRFEFAGHCVKRTMTRIGWVNLLI
jgi:hypothetical protein